MMSLRIIVFRVDASLGIGTGHVMRCLTLADELRKRGCECHFICREYLGNLNDLISKRDFTVHRLPDLGLEFDQGLDSPVHAGWLGANWRTDAEQVRSVIADMTVDWIVVDHYAIDVRWEKELRPVCRKLMAIDDLADREHDCDLLLDQNLIKGWQDRYHDKVPANCGKILGPEYALLQPIYAELHDRVPPREGPIRRVMVYFGGADIDNLTGMAISAFESIQGDDIEVDVVINPSSIHIESVRRQVEKDKRICLHERLPTLAQLMLKADLAVGAGGATSWERCCLGLPSLVITLAENQRPIAEELDKLGFVQWVGNKDVVDATGLAQALQKIIELGLWLDWSQRCSALVDGHGVKRVADFVLLNAKTPLRARLARRDDEKMLLNWANDPLVRKNAFNMHQIDSATHRKWFYSRLRDLENCRLFILETERGLPIGQVRFEQNSDGWVVTYSLDSCARGSGLGQSILQIAMLAFRESTNQVLIFARVKDANISFRNISEQLDFYSEDRGGRLSITVCSDATSWINASVPGLILGWLADGHSVAWSHDAANLPGGNLCFYLSYGRIVDAKTRALYGNNLVAHASDLPNGRGWSPASWLILEGAERIPVTLLEAVDAVDSGPIYLQEWILLNGTELIDEWRDLISDSTANLVRRFVAKYPAILECAREQAGESSIYRRRRAKDSELDSKRAIVELFNHLRIVDNSHYPAFFRYKGKEYLLKISIR
jgi:UDP-2,4-diacetamido-2,4,6-trideoxy-beta-L-altropyranose hydrolase